MPRPDSLLRPYRVETVHARDDQDKKLVDVRLIWPDRVWSLLGRRGPAAERLQAGQALERPHALPVFIGAGIGAGIQMLLDAGVKRVAIVDRERPIRQAAGLDVLRSDPRLVWLDAPRAEDVLASLISLARKTGQPILPLPSSLYLRLDPAYYGAVLKALAPLEAQKRPGATPAADRSDPAGVATRPRFAQRPRRIIFLVRGDWLIMREIIEACQELGIICYPIDLLGFDSHAAFLDELERAVALVQPAYLLTVNHYGVDQGGRLIDFLERRRLPLASWLVDNPELILYRHAAAVSDFTAIFSTSLKALASLKERGFKSTAYLPLGTTPRRFAPFPTIPDAHPWRARVSFVGNSWLDKIVEHMRKGRFPGRLLSAYRTLGAAYGKDPSRLPSETLAERDPAGYELFATLGSMERQQLFDVLAIWEANRRYRLRCVERLLPHAPLIVGDAHWKRVLRDCDAAQGLGWRWLERIDYYEDLPRFYPLSDVNFNCTSAHMRGALNQGLFDIPACGAFVVTDWQDQLEAHFEPNKEIAFYRAPEEIPHVIERWLSDPAGRESIVQASRRRILSEHTYVKRVQELDATMSRRYG